MRRRLVIAIALLSVCQTAGTCEFRATSNNGITQPPPPVTPKPTQEGLIVNLHVGDTGQITRTTSSTSSIVEAVLATSVLTHRSPSPTERNLRNAFNAQGPESLAIAAVVAADEDAITNAVPEPTAAWLFVTGLLFMAWTIRQSASVSHPD